MKSSFRCPSNIALVKYWGKKEAGIQMPANASISLSLGDLYAETSVETGHGNVSGQPSFSFWLDGVRKPGFEPKLLNFLKRLWPDFELIRNHHLNINSSNNFPHGAGIASSAAGFGALALCLCRLEEKLSGKKFDHFIQKASETARLGSGSACRSMYAKPAIWGQHPAVAGSSDLYAVPFQGDIHADLAGLMDAVLIVDEAEKAVSSSAGHALLKGNPYAESRFAAATQNLGAILECFSNGQIRRFIHIVESEALQLHAMMMVSNPYYILMRPNTLAIIEQIWTYRESSGTPLMFTLDAGANVHVLFPASHKSEVLQFIHDKLLVYCKNSKYLCSITGTEPLETE